MKFSLDEVARREIRDFFEEALNSVGEETEKLFTELVAIYTREQYKPLFTMTAKVADYYTEEFKNTVQNQFDNWLDSNTSIKSFALELEAGDDDSDDAYRAAESLENDLQNVLIELFSKQPDIPSVNTEAHLTKDDNEIFDEINELVQKYNSTVEDLISDYSAKSESNCEENQIYQNVSEILEAILGSYKSLFEVFNEGVNNIAEHINNRGIGARNKSEADKAQMKSEAETAGETLRDVSGLFDFE